MSNDSEQLRRSLAHDLRNPLTSLQMLVELAEPGADGSLRFDATLAPMLLTALADLNALTERIEAGTPAKNADRSYS